MGSTHPPHSPYFFLDEDVLPIGAAMHTEPAKDELKIEENKDENTKEKKEELKQPSPFILYVDLHCLGCAKKIERTISKIRGVERVTIDMAQNQVTINGVIEPQSVCARIVKKTKRSAKVLSPLPQAEDETIPEIVDSQVSRLTTVELIVNMHCEACAKQLKRKILKMRGVRTAETNQSLGKVIVTGSMDANKLVDYVYKRTKKQAKIVLQPEPRKHNEEPKSEDLDPNPNPNPNPGEKAKKLKEEEKKEGGNDINKASEGEEIINKMMYYGQSLYVIERIPPPQLFSDENPNACYIM
ncbi:hypothetical protein HAX54_013715 [Datura stramonium]|uniref:HMA domain-containing protein n=1 Tax=Datura stramonium TaxID=4076 RepID=A0ABS8TNA4_DATST|nr:hypothetical protein [Datura stramonium]